MIELDARKLLCPMPVIRLGEAVKLAKNGNMIKVIATDIGVLHDIPAWCKVHQHLIISIDENEYIEVVVQVVK